MKALQRIVCSLIFLGSGVHMVNAEEQGSQVQQRMREKDLYQTPQADFPWKRMLRWETCQGEKFEGTSVKRKEKRNSQGEDLCTPKADSQGKDPRTVKEPVQR